MTADARRNSAEIPPGRRMSRRARGLRLAFALAWTLGVLVACWTPPGPVSAIEPRFWLFRLPHFDKAVHFLLFAGFAVAWTAVFGFRASIRRPRAIAAIAAAGVALAFLTEWVQGWSIVGRTSDLADAAADVSGVALGLLAAWAVTASILRLARSGSPSNDGSTPPPPGPAPADAPSGTDEDLGLVAALHPDADPR